MGLEEKFQELVPAMTAGEALAATSACLYCYDAPCVQACPTSIDVPSFIKKIATGNLKGSAKSIFSSNVLGASCARVCPVEVLCEGACVQNHLVHEPVQIARLQRYATDAALQAGWTLFHKGPSNGRKVACIGAGPASLSVAFVLAQRGYEVVLYDERELPGGLNTYAMADYKLKIPLVQQELTVLKELGVRFEQRTRVGRDVAFAELEQQYDALFLGTGLGATNALGIPGEDLPGVVDALSFIERLKTRPYEESRLTGDVIVIGAGNTAIDAVTQARRLGARSSTIVYRRGEADISAYDYEYKLGKSDGCRFEFNAAPRRLEQDGSRLKLVCERDGAEVVFHADLVVRAIGQQKTKAFFLGLDGISLDEKGRVQVDPKTHQTGNARYFAGGDCVNGGAEAVNAVAEGKVAAAGIHAWLDARATQAA